MSTSRVRTRAQRLANPGSPLRTGYVRQRPPRRRADAPSPENPPTATGSGDDPTVPETGSEDDTTPTPSGPGTDTGITNTTPGGDPAPIDTASGGDPTPIDTGTGREANRGATIPGFEGGSAPPTPPGPAPFPGRRVGGPPAPSFGVTWGPEWLIRYRRGDTRRGIWRWTKWLIPKLIVLVVFFLLCSLLAKTYYAAHRIWYRVYGSFGDGQANASRLLVNPFGTKHIPYIANSSLTVDTFCSGSKQDPHGLAPEIALIIGRTAHNAQTWKDTMLVSKEPEFQKVARLHDRYINDNVQLANRSATLEKRMCKLSHAAMTKGLAHQQTRNLAKRLRDFRAAAEILRPEKQTRQMEDNVTAATPLDWDYKVVTKALQDMKTYLQNREKVARVLSIESRDIRNAYLDLIQDYLIFKYKVRIIGDEARNACREISARKWIRYAWNCNTQTRSELLALQGGHDSSADPARKRSITIEWYLKQTESAWENYAKHLDYGLNLLKNIPKFMVDLTAEGIPARISHLQSLFDTLANQADLTAVLLEDAYEKKYSVEIIPEKGRIVEGNSPRVGPPPEAIGCELCDRPRQKEWEWASKLDDKEWAVEEQTRPPTTTTIYDAFGLGTTHQPLPTTTKDSEKKKHTRGWNQVFS